MLLNLSNNPKETKEKITKEIGKIYDLKTRQNLGGVNSGKLIITKGSIDIFNLLILNKGLSTCNIEIRPDGIIIRFQAALETYALVIPFYKLRVYKGQAEEYTLFRDNQNIKVKADRPEIHDFMKKIRHCKSEHWSSSSFLDQ